MGLGGSALSSVPSTLTRWSEAAKVLDGDSMHDCMAGRYHGDPLSHSQSVYENISFHIHVHHIETMCRGIVKTPCFKVIARGHMYIV